MPNANPYSPPFTVTPAILRLVGKVSEMVGRLSAQQEGGALFHLRKANRVRTIQGSLAIEGNSLSEEQITAILDGKRVVAPIREIQEVHNAIAAYDRLEDWTAHKESDLLAAHATLTRGLLEESGRYRDSGVGIMGKAGLEHMAPPAKRVPQLMADLLGWLATTDHHPLIKSPVFHYEFEFIHPFADGNGRAGRLWQTLLLTSWNPMFARIPVESMVYAHQQEYYQAIRESTRQGQSAPFIEFMLIIIRDTMRELSTPHDTPQDTPQVTKQVLTLLEALASGTPNGLTREELQQALRLKDRKSFSQTYLTPAIQAGLIAMTLPGKPTSRNQRYILTKLGGGIVKGKIDKKADYEKR